MGTAHNGEDDIAQYAYDIGETRELAATTTGDQTTDDDGPLTPGRYLIQVRDVTAGATVWIHVGRYEKSDPLSLTAAPGVRRVPLAAINAIETNVRAGDSDRIGAITDLGVATVYLSRLSTGA